MLIESDHDRRDTPRISLTRPCKLYEPRSCKYIAGSTCNIGPGGMLLRLDRAIALEEDDSVYVAVAQKRRQRLLRSEDMIEAKVTRTVAITSGETAVAVRFTNPSQVIDLPVRIAA